MSSVANIQDSASTIGPAASFVGTLYAVATDTWWYAAATMVATVAGVALNVFKLWREANNVELNLKLAAAQKEISDIKDIVSSINKSNQETIESLSKSHEDSISVVMTSHQDDITKIRDSICEIKEKLNNENTEVQRQN